MSDDILVLKMVLKSVSKLDFGKNMELVLKMVLKLGLKLDFSPKQKQTTYLR